MMDGCARNLDAEARECREKVRTLYDRLSAAEDEAGEMLAKLNRRKIRIFIAKIKLVIAHIKSRFEK